MAMEPLLNKTSPTSVEGTPVSPQNQGAAAPVVTTFAAPLVRVNSGASHSIEKTHSPRNERSDKPYTSALTSVQHHKHPHRYHKSASGSGTDSSQVHSEHGKHLNHQLSTGEWGILEGALNLSVRIIFILLACIITQAMDGCTCTPVWLQGLSVGSKMIPFDRVYGLSTDTVVTAAVLTEIAATAHSRVPVFQCGDKLHVKGTTKQLR
jgi:hypothetical protein